MPDTSIVIRGKNLSGPAMAQLQADVMKTSKNFVDANKSAVQFEQTTGKVSKAVIGVGGAIAGLGMAKLGSDIVANSTKLNTLDLMLTNIEGSQAKANKRFEEFKILAKAPVLDPFNLSKYYTSLKSVNVEAPLAIGFMKNLANAMAGVGSGNEDFARSMEQVVQMMGKGKLVGQDLRVIAESFPQIRKYLGEAFGGIVDPEELAKKGYTALDVMEKLNAEMAKAPRFTGGAQAAQDNFRQSMALFEGELGKAFLPTFGKVLEGLTGLMDSFNKLPEATKTALGWGTAGVLGGVGLLGIGGTIAFLVNQIKELTGIGGIKAVANVGANVASGAVASAERAWVRNPAIAEGMAGAWVREGKAAPSAFMAGSTALQIATATIAAGTLVFAGAEIYKAFTRDFTAEEKKNIAGAPQKAWDLGMNRLQEAQMGKGNFPNMTVGELGTEDFINGLLEHMGLPVSARGLTLQQLKEKYGYAYPTQIYKEPAGPPEPTKKALPPAINPEDLGFMGVGPFRPGYRDVERASGTGGWLDSLNPFKMTADNMPAPKFTYDFLEFMKSEAAKSSIIASLENLTPEMLGGSRGRDVSLSSLTGFGVTDDLVKRKQIEIDVTQQAFEEWKAGYGELSEGISYGAREGLASWNELINGIQIGFSDTLSLIGQGFSLLQPILENMFGMSRGTSSTISGMLSGAMSGMALGAKLSFLGPHGALIGAGVGAFSGLMKGVSFDDPYNDNMAYMSGARSGIAMSRKSASDFIDNFERGFSKGSESNQDSGLGSKLDKLINLMENTKYEFYLDSDPISSKVRKKIEQKKARGEWA